ncbi:MAG: pilus assembly protein, partial [Gammaproteobacteria bacterium]
GAATLVYAGDLQGNLWKVDLTAKTFAGTLVFKATDGSVTPKAQPITTTPVVSLHPNAPKNGGYMVYFGTGQFLGLPDISDTSLQTVYGIWDDLSNKVPNPARTGTDLVGQTITVAAPTVKNFVSGTNSARLITSKKINWSTQRGWYIDLPTSGEREITDAVLDSKRLVFTTFIPSTDPCNGNGQSWLMVVDYATGGAPTKPQIDLYGKGTYDKVKDLSGLDQIPVGILFGDYIATPTALGGPTGGSDTLLVSKSDTNIQSVNINGGTRGRQSWIQVQ